jgi:hypothetical protein
MVAASEIMWREKLPATFSHDFGFGNHVLLHDVPTSQSKSQS